MNFSLKSAAAGGNQPALGQQATDVVDVLPTDTRKPIRLGFWVLVVGFGGFLAWAAFAPLDEGVSAPATVSIETRRKTIQHLNGGVIKQVLVKEGQQVKAGDVLIELDDGVTRANFESIRVKKWSPTKSGCILAVEVCGPGNKVETTLKGKPRDICSVSQSRRQATRQGQPEVRGPGDRLEVVAV